MNVTPYIPVIVEATRFVFNEIGKWIDHVRKRSEKTSSGPSEGVSDEKVPKLTQQEFTALETNLPNLMTKIDSLVAETHAYEIKALVVQIQIHRRNFIDHETTEAEYGALTPQHVKRAIEREATAIVEKSERLKSLLEQMYGRRIQNS